MRLTPDLIQRSAQFFNCIKDRELDLRGGKIPAIENLGATQDGFDVIDFTDNEIRKLDNFPLLKRLKTMLLSNNRIARIGDELGSVLPNLHTLVLTANSLQNLSDLDPLADLRNLTNLVLLENNVTKQPHYRSYVIHTIPQLKVLDFKKVRKTEREAAVKIFGEEKKATSALGKKSFVAVPDESGKKAKTGPTPEEIMAIKVAVANAKTLEEVMRLEKQLKSGVVPELPGAEAMAE